MVDVNKNIFGMARRKANDAEGDILPSKAVKCDDSTQ